MNAKDLRGQTPDQLRDQLASLKRESFYRRVQQATGQVGISSRMRQARRDAARVLTILNQKAAQAAQEA